MLDQRERAKQWKGVEFNGCDGKKVREKDQGQIGKQGKECNKGKMERVWRKDIRKEVTRGGLDTFLRPLIDWLKHLDCDAEWLVLSGSSDREILNDHEASILPMRFWQIYALCIPKYHPDVVQVFESDFWLAWYKGGKRNCSVLTLCTAVRRKNASMFTTLFTLLLMDLRDIGGINNSLL